MGVEAKVGGCGPRRAGGRGPIHTQMHQRSVGRGKTAGLGKVGTQPFQPTVMAIQIQGRLALPKVIVGNVNADTPREFITAAGPAHALAARVPHLDVFGDAGN